MSVGTELIEALRGGKIAEVRSAIKAAPEAARHARAIVEAGRLAFKPALELLHKHGADLNAIWKGYRPLHSLIQEDPHHPGGKPVADRLPSLEWLLENGADPEQLAAWPPARAIVIAGFVGEREYVTRLKKAGARMDGFAGAALGDRKLVEKALKQPEFAKARDHGGLTALQCAAASRMAGTFEIARLLVDAGADLFAKTKSWNHDIDAVYLAASSKNHAIFELLLDHGADPTEALTPAIWNGNEDLAELTIARGADPNRAVAERQPLLNNLIRWGQMRQAFWLLAHGADPNLPDDRGWTAVHQAASRGNERMMRALLESGGDTSHRNNEGNTPADIARSMRREKLSAMIAGAA